MMSNAYVTMFIMWILYIDVSFYIADLFIMISYIGGQETLYCSHETLHISILEPSVFSQISGNQLTL